MLAAIAKAVQLHSFYALATMTSWLWLRTAKTEADRVDTATREQEMSRGNSLPTSFDRLLRHLNRRLLGDNQLYVVHRLF